MLVNPPHSPQQLRLGAPDEAKLRELAIGIAKGIEPTEDLLGRMGLTAEDYKLLSDSNVFRAMLDQAVMEWQGASNTAKRVRLKAAVNLEEGLVAMYAAMVNASEPLAARVKVFETMARIAGLGAPEVVPAASGSAFRLEINLGARGQITVGAQPLTASPRGEIVEVDEWDVPEGVD